MKKTLLILLFALGVSYWGWGQISITTPGVAQSQNFNTLAISGTSNTWTDNTTIAGWYTNRVVYIADDGTSNTGGLHSYGSTSATERALGALTSGSVATVYIGVRIQNNTGSTLTSFDIAYKGEQWRQTANAHTLVFEYQIGATSLTTGTWTAVSALDFTAPKTGTAGAIDGNAVGNYSNKSTTLNVVVSNSQEIWFRWTKTGSTSPGLGIDDFSVTPNAGANIPPVITNIVQTPSTNITSSTSVSVSADITDSDGTISSAEVKWGTVSGSLTNTIAMSLSAGSTYTTNSNIPPQAHGTTVYYKVFATDDDGGNSSSLEFSYSVFDPQTTTLPYNETFASNLGNCYTYSVLGTSKYWVYNASGWAQMNGFGSTETEEDWLVLPCINFNSYSYEFITFDTWYNFGTDDANNYMKLLYSTDYAGIGNPSSATWTELTFTKPAASQTWTSSGSVNLAGITGSSVYLAFKYNYQVSMYRLWEVDNIVIDQGTPDLVADFSADQTNINTGSTVNFTDATSGGALPYTYAWDLDGDGAYDDSTDPNPSYIYNTPGTYTIRLQVTDNNMTVDSEIKTDYIAVISVATNIIINEADSDTPGTDILEFIELYDGGTGNTDLSGLVLVLYNGSNDLSYGAYDLDGYSTDAGGYFVLGNGGVTNVDYVIVNGVLQNGQDAVALFIGNAAAFPNNTAVTTSNLLDALVYDTDDADDPGLLALLNTGEPQINENGRSNAANHSCQRIPNGSGGQRNTSTYDVALPTPGAMNFPVYTNWTGLISNSWDEAGNWDYGVPTSVKEVTIPDVAKASFPVISGAAVCANLTMNTGSSLQIGPSGSLTVTGTFTNNGWLTIKSDATGTGSLIENNGVAATVERYLTEDKWHYVSAPVDNPTANVFYGIYMMQWDEPSGLWSYITDPNYVMATDMQGFAVWSQSGMTGNTTVSFTGNLNTGTKSINVTAAGPTAHNGYNFAGNPYTSSVDWDVNDGSGWSRTAGNIDLTVYIWNQSLLNYGVYTKGFGGIGTNGVSNIIPPHQGFFVHCSAPTGSLGINNGTRIHSTNDILKSEEIITSLMKMKVEGNNYADEMILRKNPLASTQVDLMDGTKLFGSEAAPQMYSISKDGEQLSINSFPESEDYQIIPIGLEAGVNGVYTFTFEIFEGFNPSCNLVLEDLKEGTFTLVNANTTYDFISSLNDEPMRFLLHLNGQLAVPENNSGLSGVSVYSYNQDVYINSEKNLNGSAIIYDLLGREILHKNLNGESVFKINLNDHKGYMIVNVTTDQGMLNQKVYIR